MVLYDLYQVTYEYTETLIMNRCLDIIYDGFLSELSLETLATRVLHIEILSANRISITIDTTESEVKL